MELEKKKWIVFLLFLFISVCAVIVSKENYQAATSYTNAKEFYESTALDGEPYHSEHGMVQFIMPLIQNLHHPAQI